MSGFFVVGEKKERPGVYKRYENAGGVEAAGARSGVGCALVTGNWGALNTPVTIDQSTDVSNVIGAGSGYDAITAFMAGGMEECVVVRVGTGGTPATITLKDTTASAAVDAVVLTALYPGNRAFTITVKASLDDETAKEATIYEGTKALEKVTFAAGKTEVDGIVTAFANSKYVKATKKAPGNGTLADVTQKAFTAGTNPTVNTAAYGEAANASEAEALISYDMRVRKDVECSNIPDKQPDMIIRKIQISDCILNEKEDIKISFNPQMNTIIGGRGSGKSSIIRTIAGAMNSFSGENLNVISEEQKNFYKENGKSKSSGTRKGIFKRTSQVSVFIERLSDLYKIEVTDIKGMENQTRKLFKYIDGEWNVIEDEHFLDLFKAQIFTQKQIYELAMDSNSLMAIIDADIKELPQCLSEKDAALNNLVSKALEISNSKRIILDKPRLETELLDIESQISKYEKSGISDTLKEKQLFDDQEKALLSYIDRKKNKIDEIKKYLDEVVIAYDDVTDSEIKSLLEEDLNEFKLDINRLNQFCNEMLSKNDKLFEKLDNTEWKKKRIAIQNKYVSVMQNLQDNGLDTVKLDTLMEQRNNKKEEIDRILIKEKQLCKLEEEYESLESVYRNKVDIIYKLRNNFIQEVIGNDKNVKFQLAKNRNRNSFINNLKAIMQKEITSVDDDINELADLYFKKEDGIEKYKKMLISIRNKEDQKSLSKKTRDIITSIAEDSFARMIAFIPDDDLIVSYRPEKAKKFIPLSNASAGQKTTTILTFLLAYGNQPLLLDQPEDDLDNRLVYDLIVARLKVAKSKRQIIVVTHNANIPVNGDSEYIISMDSETDIIQVNQTGTMDDESMRQEICDVMEGTKDAFEMRAKKYHFNIKE